MKFTCKYPPESGMMDIIINIPERDYTENEIAYLTDHFTKLMYLWAMSKKYVYMGDKPEAIEAQMVRIRSRLMFAMLCMWAIPMKNNVRKAFWHIRPEQEKNWTDERKVRDATLCLLLTVGARPDKTSDIAKEYMTNEIRYKNLLWDVLTNMHAETMSAAPEPSTPANNSEDEPCLVDEFNKSLNKYVPNFATPLVKQEYIQGFYEVVNSPKYKLTHSLSELDKYGIMVLNHIIKKAWRNFKIQIDRVTHGQHPLKQMGNATFAEIKQEYGLRPDADINKELQRGFDILSSHVFHVWDNANGIMHYILFLTSNDDVKTRTHNYTINPELLENIQAVKMCMKYHNLPKLTNNTIKSTEDNLYGRNDIVYIEVCMSLIEQWLKYKTPISFDDVEKRMKPYGVLLKSQNNWRRALGECFLRLGYEMKLFVLNEDVFILSPLDASQKDRPKKYTTKYFKTMKQDIDKKDVKAYRAKVEQAKKEKKKQAKKAPENSQK